MLTQQTHSTTKKRGVLKFVVFLFARSVASKLGPVKSHVTCLISFWQRRIDQLSLDNPETTPDSLRRTTGVSDGNKGSPGSPFPHKRRGLHLSKEELRQSQFKAKAKPMKSEGQAMPDKRLSKGKAKTKPKPSQGKAKTKQPQSQGNAQATPRQSTGHEKTTPKTS